MSNTIKKTTIKSLTFDALFLALIFVFAFVPYLGYITIGPLAFTTMHILIILGAALFGAKRGALYGFFFGLTSFIVAFQYPGTLNYMCINPFISILPRVLFGFISGLVFDFIKKFASQKVFNGLLFPLCGIFTLLHTILYFVCFYIFGYLDVTHICQLLGMDSLIDYLRQYQGGLLGFIAAYMTIGCLCEIGAAIVIVPLVYIPVSKFYKIGAVNSTKFEFNQKSNVFYVSLITLIALISVIIFSVII